MAFRWSKAKALIKKSGRTRVWFAEQLDLTPETFTQYLNGHGKIGRQKIVRLAALLEVAAIDLDPKIDAPMKGHRASVPAAQAS